MADLDWSDTAIYDEMYGYIPLTKTELELVNHNFFQRLNHIKQLGAAYRVFPGAQHTRFSHSLGVMYMMDRMINAPLLESEILTPENKQKLRIAALLHDIGHYPLSHLTETVMTRNGGYTHEKLGEFVVNNTSIAKILEANGIDPKEIGRIITGESPEPLFNQLMSSELDADRFDYLLRDSVHTGVAHGRFDVNRLIHTLALDRREQLCVDKSGMHAAEGYTIGRYLMYTVVYTHKTINAFDLLIKRIYTDCIGLTLPSFDELKKMITEEEPSFAGFDDTHVFKTINQKALEDGFTAEICKMFMSRKVLSIAKEAQGMSENGKGEKDYFILNQYSSQDKIKTLAESSGVPPEWIFHHSPNTSLPHLRPLIEQLEGEGEERQKEMSKALRIVDKNKVSRPLALVDTSIVFYLKNMSLDTVRIYTKEEFKNKLEAALDHEVGETR